MVMSSLNRISNIIIRTFGTSCSGFLKSAASHAALARLEAGCAKTALGVNDSPENGFEVIQPRGLKATSL